MIGLDTGVFVIRAGVGAGDGVARYKGAVVRARTRTSTSERRVAGWQVRAHEPGVLESRLGFDSSCDNGEREEFPATCACSSREDRTVCDLRTTLVLAEILDEEHRTHQHMLAPRHKGAHPPESGWTWYTTA